MPRDDDSLNGRHTEQTSALLAPGGGAAEFPDDVDGDGHGEGGGGAAAAAAATTDSTSPDPSRPPVRRQPSLYKPSNGGVRTPRTLNRVRFDIEDEDGQMQHSNGHASAPSSRAWPSPTASDDASPEDTDEAADRDGGQRAPLLTGIEAPSVTVASEWDFNAEDYLEGARPKSGMKSAFLNMANSIIGAGIIGQPYAFRQAGLVTGLALLIGLTVVVDWTIRLIVINSKLSGANSFQGTVQQTFGKSGLVAISVAQWAFAFGGMIAFCIIIGDTIPQVLRAVFPSLPNTHFLWLLTNRRAVIVILILGVSYPLSLYRDIAKLAKASGFALASMLVIVIAILSQGPRVPQDLRGDLKGSLVIKSGVSQAIGVISFAFVCHHNSLLIYGSLRKPTLDRFSQVTHYSTFISMVACLAVAMAGFLTFGDKTDGNVLNNFPTDNLMVNIARLCFGLNMLTSLPLECFVCREVMLNYWFPDQPFNMNLHLIFTSALVVTAMMMALITCDLGAVFELVGATSACVLAYILPPLCYVKLARRSWRTIPAIVCATFGGVVMLISLMQAMAKMIRNEGEARMCN